MKWTLVVVVALAAAVLLILIVGALLPRDHVATRWARINASPEAVWKALTSPAEFPAWRSDVARVDLLPPSGHGASWREYSRHGALTMETDAAEPPRRLVSRIADKNLPYAGEWEYVIVPEGVAASRVTITERGTVHNPLFRFVSRVVMGHTATIDTYLRHLGKHFGEDVAPAAASTPARPRGV